MRAPFLRVTIHPTFQHSCRRMSIGRRRLDYGTPYTFTKSIVLLLIDTHTFPVCYTKQLIRFCDATKFPRSRRHRHRLLTCWGENTHISFFRSDDWEWWLCNALFLLTNSRESVGVNRLATARQTKTRLFERRSDVTPPDGARHLSSGKRFVVSWSGRPFLLWKFWSYPWLGQRVIRSQEKRKRVHLGKNRNTAFVSFYCLVISSVENGGGDEQNKFTT